MQKEPVAALEWQIWWAALTPEVQWSAKDILQHLLVNPTAHCCDLPSLEPVPLTLTVTIKQMQLRLMVEAEWNVGNDGTGQPQDLGVVCMTDVQVGSKA